MKLSKNSKQRTVIMTYKIIIGDIDVTECGFRLERDNQQKCKCYHATGFGVICDCEKWNNCYFKQLEQVKQENKRLLETINAKPLETVDVDCAFEIEKLKEQLQAKEKECEKLKDDLQHNCIREGCRYYEDNTYKVFYKCKAKTEADKMEQKIKQVKSFVAGLMFDVDCTNWFERFVVGFEDWKTQLGNDRDRYKQALDEIERYFDKRCDICREQDGLELDCNFCWKKDIKDIINKAKEQ